MTESARGGAVVVNGVNRNKTFLIMSLVLVVGAVEVIHRVLGVLGVGAAPAAARLDAPKRRPPAVAPKPKPKPRLKAEPETAGPPPPIASNSCGHIFVDGNGRRAYALSPDGTELSVARLLGLRGAPDDGAVVVGVVGTLAADARSLNEIDTTEIRYRYMYCSVLYPYHLHSIYAPPRGGVASIEQGFGEVGLGVGNGPAGARGFFDTIAMGVNLTSCFCC